MEANVEFFENRRQSAARPEISIKTHLIFS
jgi:hypothetical protein